MKIKVLIFDDHTLVRIGIRRILEDFSDMEVVGEAADGEAALTMVDTHHPDVVLLDMSMPGIDGWEVMRRLKKSHQDIRIIVITFKDVESLPVRVLQQGAMGFLTKGSGSEEMADAIRTVYKGERYLGAAIAQKMAISSLQSPRESPFASLTDRETQIMLMITRGLTMPEMVEQLFLSAKTINGHRYRMFEKLGVKNDVELTWLAIKHGVIY